jgi:primosomal protein N'
MIIREITFQHRNDFAANMLCEHCGHVQKLTSGYDDHNYHANVIPRMKCNICHKDRAGNVEQAA